MKKISILPILGLLAACGGGSGGHSGVAGSEYDIDVMRAGTVDGAVSAAVAESNQEVTNMVSEIGVADDGSMINIGRNSFTYKGKEYTSYKLSNVHFNMADEGFGGDLTFHVNDNGEIDKLVLLHDPEDEDEHDKEYVRDGKTKKFNGKVEDWENATLTYNSLGKKVGLKYSDFGGIDISAIDGWRPVFAGGYEVKRINPENIEKDATFSGKATGSVASVLNGEGSGTSITLDSNAKLKFDARNGTSELTAKFDNWYDVKYTEAGETKSIALSNYTNPNDAYRMLNDTGNGIILDNVAQLEYSGEVDMDGVHTVDAALARQNANAEEINLINSDIRYYGNNNVPYESVGIIQVRDCAGGVCGDVVVDINEDNHEDPLELRRNDEVRMNLSFGAKR